jgi:hypothetical protein
MRIVGAAIFSVALLGLSESAKAIEITSIELRETADYVEGNLHRTGSEFLLPLVLTTKEEMKDVAIAQAPFQLCLFDGAKSDDPEHCPGKLLAKGFLAHPIEIHEPTRTFDVDLVATLERNESRSALLTQVQSRRVWAMAKVELLHTLGPFSARETQIVNQRLTLAGLEKADVGDIVGRKAQEVLQILKVNELHMAIVDMRVANFRGRVILTNGLEAAVPCKGGRLSLFPSGWRGGGRRPLVFGLQDFTIPQPLERFDGVEVLLQGQAYINGKNGPDATILDDMNSGSVIAVFEGTCTVTGDDFPIRFPIALRLDRSDADLDLGGGGPKNNPQKAPTLVRTRLQVDPLPKEILDQVVGLNQIPDRVREAVERAGRDGNLVIEISVHNPLPGNVQLIVREVKLEGPIRKKKGLVMDPPRLTLFEGRGIQAALLTPQTDGTVRISGPMTPDLRKALQVPNASGLPDCLLTYEALLRIPVLGDLPIGYQGTLTITPAPEAGTRHPVQGVRQPAEVLHGSDGAQEVEHERPAPSDIAQPGTASHACATVVREDAKQRAAALMQAGKDAMSATRYDDALHLFEQAYCLAPIPTIRHALSSAELSLGHCDEALHQATTWELAPGSGHRDEARQWLGEVNRQCVEVVLHTDPDGAEVHLDGTNGKVVVTPWRGVLHVGEHSASVSKNGFAPLSKSFRVSAGSGNESVDVGLILSRQPAP